MKYDPIDQLNRENDRRTVWLLLQPAVHAFIVFAGIILVYAFGKQIDAFANRHPIGIAFLIVGGCSFGLYRLFKSAW